MLASLVVPGRNEEHAIGKLECNFQKDITNSASMLVQEKVHGQIIKR